MDRSNRAHVYHLDTLPRANAIEFPANVQNPDKAIDMVGGPEAVQNAIEDHNETPLELRLRREDRFEHPISARPSKNENLLLRVTVARKFLDQANGDFHKAIKLSNGKYNVRPSHVLATNFRFREMTDFQYNTSNSAFVQKMKGSIYSADWEGIKKLSFDDSEKFDGDQIDSLPPPRFSQQHYPYQYYYRQNPAIAVVDDGKGGTKFINTALAQKAHASTIPWEQPPPTGPKEENPRMSEAVKQCIDSLRQLFDKRPFWTRKALECELSTETARSLRLAIPQVAYCYTSGPYRSVYVRFGINPRDKPEYAMYQAEHFRVENERKKGGRRPEIVKGPVKSYEFDGIQVPSIRMIQYLDITDPILKNFIHSAKLRDSGDSPEGWFYPEDMEIIKRLMRAKLLAARQGTPLKDSKSYEIIEAVRRGKKEPVSDESDTNLADDSMMRPDEEYEPDERDLEDSDGVARSSSEDDDDDDDAHVAPEDIASRHQALLQQFGQDDQLKDLLGYTEQSGQRLGGSEQ